ncbi:MAG: hypothetical protein RL701_5709, partial [Pseudomonadota bacterium]
MLPMLLRMPRSRIARATLLATQLALAACNSSESNGSDGVEFATGAVNLALSAGGTEVSSVNYKITGNGLTREGTIPLTANGNTFSALIPGIPVGQGYTIALNGAGGDGAGQCVGSAQFGITAGQTSSVTVHLRCPGSKQTGSLLVNGDINTCAVAESAGAASTNITVGKPVVLTGIGADQDQAPSALTYTWTIVGGAATLKDANKATAE